MRLGFEKLEKEIHKMSVRKGEEEKKKKRRGRERPDSLQTVRT